MREQYLSAAVVYTPLILTTHTFRSIVAALLAVGVLLPLLVVTLFWLVYGAILLGKRLTRDAPPPVEQS